VGEAVIGCCIHLNVLYKGYDRMYLCCAHSQGYLNTSGRWALNDRLARGYPRQLQGSVALAEGLPHSAKPCSEKGVRLAQKMQVGPCILVGIQQYMPKLAQTSGPTWRLAHLRREPAARRQRPRQQRAVGVARTLTGSAVTEPGDIHLADTGAAFPSRPSRGP
jgi:hypothetical protein